MTNIDQVARADIAQTRVQLHQMTTALLKTVAALDTAFQALERVVPLLANHDDLDPVQIETECRIVKQARSEVLSTRLYLRPQPEYRRQ